jgi:hypothetical protein
MLSLVETVVLDSEIMLNNLSVRLPRSVVWWYNNNNHECDSNNKP